MTDLTLVVNKSKFDEAPEGVSAMDAVRWANFRQQYHDAQRLMPVGDFPIQLDFGLNSDCNYRCRNCEHYYKPSSRIVLPFELFARAIDEGARYGLCSIKLNHNNEPLLLPNLDDYILYARSRGVLNFYLATNGSLLTADYSRRLIEAGLNKIMVSIDATTPETYALMRNSHLFDRVVGNVLRLLDIRNSLGKRQPFVRVNFLLTGVNVHEREDFIKTWDGVADMIGFQDMLGIPDVEQSLFRQHPIDSFRCSFPFKHITIAANGDMLPCCTFSGQSIVLGNIRTMTIQEAWSCGTIANLRDLHYRGEYFNHPVCSNCFGV